MTSVFVVLVTFSAWVSVKTNEAEVISGSDEILVFAHGHRVDVSTVCSFREDTLNTPSELGCLVAPHCNLCV
jgi:hypothetical protein